MKTFAFAVLTVLPALFATQAHAGAYSFECSNPRGSLNIEKNTVTLTSEMSGYSEQPVQGELVSKAFDGWGKDKPEKPEAAITIVATGKLVNLVKKPQTDECGNKGERRVYALPVLVKDAKGKVLGRDVILCNDSFYPGHCF